MPPACCRVLSSALAALLLWAKLLAYLRGFRETGALIRMICQIGSDMRYFLVVRTGMHTGCLPATSDTRIIVLAVDVLLGHAA